MGISVFNKYQTKNKTNRDTTTDMMLKLAIASFAALATADKASIDRQFLDMGRNSSLRAFTGNLAPAIEKLDEYGCWCYFYDNVGRGKGTPVDEIDGLCKTLHDGYVCAMIDAEEENADECIAWEVPYNGGQGAGADRLASCTLNNPGANCAIRACSVEGIFVDNLFAFTLGGNQINYDEFGHEEANNGEGFDPSHDAGCPVKPGVKGASGEKKCCGAYPNRFPYKTLDGARDCCGGRTYNTEILNCCAGQVKANC